MSFLLSSGTLDSLTGIFSPARSLSRGGGRDRGGKPFDASALWAAMAAPFGSGDHTARSANAISVLTRMAKRSPEVMVKVTGSQKGAAHVLANFSYISRLGHGEEKHAELFTSEKEILTSAADMRELAEHWHDHEMSGDDRRQGATSISMILSMASGTDPGALREAALAFAGEEMANRYWAAALHLDKDHPHVHLTIARRDHDGVRFHPNKDDLFRYRQIFAQKLRDRGIEANATPARARGVEPRHEPIAVRKLRDKGAVMRLDERRSALAKSIIEQARPDASLARAAADQLATKAVYQRSIAELAACPDPAQQAIASSLTAFVAAMPPPATRLSRLADGMARQARVRGGTNEPPATNTDKPQGVVDRVSEVMARAKLAREQRRASEQPLGAQWDANVSAKTSAAHVEPKNEAHDGLQEPEVPTVSAAPDTTDAIAAIARKIEERRRRFARDQAAQPNAVDDSARAVEERQRQLERDRKRDRGKGGPPR